MTPFQPTDEQAEAARLAKTGASLAIEARAGTGKTACAVYIAEQTAQRGQYVAFNKALVNDAAQRLPQNVAANTAHSLAFRAVGSRFKHRLNGPRLKSSEVARILGIDRSPLVVSYGSQKKVIQPGHLASLAMRAVLNWCQSAEPAPPTERHVPYVEGIDPPEADGKRGMRNNHEVRAFLAPLLPRIWRDLMDPDGRLRFDHAHYLKSYQLDSPVIHADFILFDECQPTGTQVLVPTGSRRIGRLGSVTPTKYVPIETLRPGDRVVSYDAKGLRLRPTGCVVSDVRSRPWEGPLVEVTSVDGKVSRYTPDHKCMAAIGPALRGKHILYLMRRDVSFRVGVTVGLHGNTNAGGKTRLQGDRGEESWLLAVYETRAEALAAEAYVSWQFGLPQMCFQVRTGGTQHVNDAFWNKVGDLTARAEACLAHFGRRLEYPLWRRGPKYTLTHRPMVVRACNLVSGMTMADGDLIMAKLAQRRLKDEELRPVTVGASYYQGLVWSLEVERDRTYVADGLVTHNCQDASPVLLDIVRQQHHAQLIFVGDSEQQLYEWLGAVDALAKVPVTNRCYLTQSFRFGPAVAEVANLILDELGADPKVVGLAGAASVVGSIDQPDAILTRTNATAVATLLASMAQGRSAHLVGGGADVVAFARAAMDLKRGQRTQHRELACFDTWGEVVEYVENDPSGSELKLLVDLLDEYGPDKIIGALDRMPAEEHADLVVSTGHRSKGRAWGRVQLAGDFPDPDKRDLDVAELRLLYVAVTRAQRELDVDACATVSALMREDTTPPLSALDALTMLAEPVAKACPSCGRSDVVRPGTGLIGAHHCAGVVR